MPKMPKAKDILLTKDFLESLQKEYTKLSTTERDRVTKRIQTAREMGDLSENSEFDSAREEQSVLEARISELEMTLKHAKVISDTGMDNDVVRVGSVVKIKSGDSEATYNIVASPQADPMNNLLSEDSPIGKALIGARVGDEVKSPTGSTFKVLAISHK